MDNSTNTDIRNNESIPKVIHYCWFGGEELSDMAKKCIESWKKYCPDYEIIRWDENNFDFSSNRFAKEAYNLKKWAFVSDYVRLYVLYKYGGIYMDTDVELVAPLDKFLFGWNNAFAGFESFNTVSTCVMACKKRNKFFKKFLDYYSSKKFTDDVGREDLTTNVVVMTELCEKYGFKMDNTTQERDGFMLYSSDVFCPKSPSSKILRRTTNTVAIHHFSGSWLTDFQKRRLILRERLYKKYNERLGWFIYQTFYLPYRLFLYCKDKNVEKHKKNINKGEYE